MASSVISPRIMSVVLLLAWFVGFGAGSDIAQSGGVEIPVIMSNPQSHAPFAESLPRELYDKLKLLAEARAEQVLALTRTELWVVPKANIAVLRKQAANYGVDVNVLAIDWNHLFRSVPVNIMMGSKQKVMMAQTMASNAAMGIGMMLSPRSAMIEYALTKGANGQASSNEPARLLLQLDDKTVLSVTRTTVEIEADRCIWRGTVDGTNAPATIMWWPGVALAGTVQHDGRIYAIRRMRGGPRAVAIVEMSEERMPPEHAPMSARHRVNNSNLRDDPLVHQGDASMLRSPIERQRSADDGSQTKRWNKDEPAPMVSTTKPGTTLAPKDIIINVIVAYTRKAASKYTDVRRELVEFAIEEANHTFRASNLGRVRLNLVHSYLTDYLEEGEHFDHLWRFADRDDGYMDEIHGLRDDYDADVAVLIVDDPKGCGLTTRVFAEAEEAFAVVHHECAVVAYSVAHEIGHLIGARHELVVDNTMTPFPYGHGYVNGTAWRDVMSYKSSCGGCPRLPIWSSPEVMIRGEPAGTALEDNARVIAQFADRVANFRRSRREQLNVAGATPKMSSTTAADQSFKSK